MTMQQGRILTAEQLVLYRTKSEKILPTLGNKEFTPSRSWLETKQIQSALDERKDLLEEERVEKLGSLATAEWKEEFKLACVTRRVGRHFEALGHEQDAALSLYPEEALYLLETNCLMLLYGGVAMSLQQGYNTLLGPTSDCSLNEYRVYSHLLRQGYRLLRHSPAVRVTRYERQIGLHHHTLGRKQKNAREKHPVKSSMEIKTETNTRSNSICIKEEVKIESQDIIELDLVQVNEVQMKNERCRKRRNCGGSTSMNENEDIKMEIEVLDLCNNADRSLQKCKTSTSEIEIIEYPDYDVISHSVCGTVPSTSTEIEEINLSDNEHSDDPHIVNDIRADDVNSGCNRADGESNIITISQQIISKLLDLVCSGVEEASSIVSKEETPECESTTEVEIKKEDDEPCIIEEEAPITNPQAGDKPVKHLVKNVSTLLTQCTGSVHDSTNVTDLVNSTENTCKGIVKDESVLEHSTLKYMDTSVISTGVDNLQTLYDGPNAQEIFDISDNSISSVSEVKIELQSNDDICGNEGSLNRTTIKQSDSSKPCFSSSPLNQVEIVNIIDDDCPVQIRNWSTSINNWCNFGNFKTAYIDHNEDRKPKLSIIKSEVEPLEVIDIDDEVTTVSSGIQPSKNTTPIRKRSSEAVNPMEVNPLPSRPKRSKIKGEDRSLVNEITNHKVIDISDDKVKSSDIKMENELSKFYEEIELVDVEDKGEGTEVEDRKKILDSFPNTSRKKILDSFPNTSGLFVVNLTVPPIQYLPPNVSPERKEYNIQLWRLKAPGIGGCPEPSEDTYNERTCNSNHHNNYQSNGGYHRPKHSRKRRGYRGAFGVSWPNSSSSPHLPWGNTGPLMNAYQPPLPLQNVGLQPHSLFMYPLNHLGQFPVAPPMPYSVPSHLVQQSWPPMQPSPWIDRQRNEIQQHANNMFEPQMYHSSRDRRNNDVIPLRSENEHASRFRENEAQLEKYDYYPPRVSKQERRKNKEHPKSNNPRYFSPPSKLKKIMHHANTVEKVQVPKEVNVPLESLQTDSWSAFKQGLNNNIQIPETLQVIGKVEASDVVVDDCVEIVDPYIDMVEEVKDELYSEELTPLLNSADCTNIDSILTKLQIIKSADFVKSNVPEEPDMIISYDVYLPNSTFRKSNPPLPDYRLTIVGYEDPMPSPGTIAAVLKDYEDGVPLLVAVNLPDSVAFFHYSTVNIPVYSGNL